MKLFPTFLSSKYLKVKAEVLGRSATHEAARIQRLLLRKLILVLLVTKQSPTEIQQIARSLWPE